MRHHADIGVVHASCLLIYVISLNVSGPIVPLSSNFRQPDSLKSHVSARRLYR
jgi:hypothetical protein